MPKRELKIPIDNKLSPNTGEEIIFRSPSTIPDKGIKDLIATKKIIGSNCSYYDIAPTENQAMKKGKKLNITIFKNQTNLSVYTNVATESGELLDRPNNNQEDIMAHFDMLMGEINE